MRYFKNNYKKLIMPTVFLSIIGLAIYIIPILLFPTRFDYSQGDTNIVAFTFFLIGVTIFVPIYEFGIIKNKRGGDLYYSLPINKRQLNLQIYLKGLIEILITYVILFFLGLFVVLIKGFDIKYFYYLPMFFMFLMGVITLYSINSFVFSKANNTIDGIFFIGAYFVLSFMIIQTIDVITYDKLGNNDFYNIDKFMFSPLMVLGYFGKSFQFLMYKGYSFNNYSVFGVLSGSMFIFWFIIGLLALGLLIFVNKFNKPENIQQKSDSWFGYKVIIPILLLTLVMMTRIKLRYTFDFMILVVFLICSYIGYVVYERTFKIKWYNLAIIFGTVFVGIILNLLI